MLKPPPPPQPASAESSQIHAHLSGGQDDVGASRTHPTANSIFMRRLSFIVDTSRFIFKAGTSGGLGSGKTNIARERYDHLSTCRHPNMVVSDKMTTGAPLNCLIAPGCGKGNTPPLPRGGDGKSERGGVFIAGRCAQRLTVTRHGRMWPDYLLEFAGVSLSAGGGCQEKGVLWRGSCFCSERMGQALIGLATALEMGG